MSDPDTLTRQDLIYAAAALRQAARHAEKQARDPGFTSMKGVFERAAKEQDASTIGRAAQDDAGVG